LLFRQPLLSATARLPPLLSIHPKSITSAERRTKISSQCSAPILFSPDIRLDSCFRRPPLPSPLRQTGLFPGLLAAAFKTLRGAPATIAYAPNP
jgi:hypothetical protein